MTAFDPISPLFEGPALTAQVAIVGGGPAGLMAADVLSQAGVAVHLFDAMPSVGRKFLLAGKGGLNLTHAEPSAHFNTRFGDRQAEVGQWLSDFGAQAVRQWAQDLGVSSFVGSSGRVFPHEMKAAPLLRAWLHRLRHPASGVPVQFHMRHRWLGWQGDALAFESAGPASVQRVHAQAVLLALGGASWPRLGSDGAWVAVLAAQGISVTPLQAANCGFDVWGREGLGWTAHFRQRFAGHPLKSVVLRTGESFGSGQAAAPKFERKGEFVITDTGVEGSLVYAASAGLRQDLLSGSACMSLDLLPDLPPQRVLDEVRWPRGSRSLSSHLKSRLGIDGVKMGLVYELCSAAVLAQPEALATALKNLPVVLKNPRPMAEAISTAGGVTLEGLTSDLMLRHHPNVFCAGEMLDWEAPTGGYLLTACLASGWCAGQGILAKL